MIVTFYSYKGGVGRSMAMANVADILAQRGIRVLMLDFDLEAPGLEQYFQIPQEAARAHDGLLDLLLAYKQAMAVGGAKSDFRDVRRFILEVYQKLQGGGSLDLMPAGRREGADLEKYVTGLRAFDWQDFYFNWEGELFFEWLRDEFVEQRYDLVLVDTRTGVTEMGGICSYQLADQMVMLCAANRQNLRGTRNAVEDFTSPRVMARRRDRRLDVVVVPARIEQRDPQLLEQFLTQFDSSFGDYFPQLLRDAGIGPRDLMIPYQPEFAFEERVVTDPASGRRDDIGAAFMGLARAITMLAPAGSRLAEVELDVAVHTAEYDVTTRFGGYDVHLAGAVARRDELQQIRRTLESESLQVFLDPLEPVPPEEWRRRSDQILFHSKVLLVVSTDLTSGQQEALRGLVRANRGAKNRPVLMVGLESPVDPELARSMEVADTDRYLVDGSPEHSAAVKTLVQRLKDLGQRVSAAQPSMSAPAPPPSPQAPPPPSPAPKGAARANAPYVSSPNLASLATSQPFRGVDSFREDSAGFFFGRERLVASLVSAIEAHRCVWLFGPSGSGKTSAVLAGVFPTLRAGGADRVLDRVELGPGCADALTKALTRFPPAKGGVRHLLFVDEVERVLGLPEPERAAVYGVLARFERDRPDVVVLLSAREDAIGHLESSPLGLDRNSPAVIRVPDFTATELRAVIERPAERGGLAYEPGLIDRIMADAGLQASTLPLVQQTLLRLWENRREGWLTNAGYEKIGGLGAVVGEIGDAALRGLQVDPTLLDRILGRLFTLEDTVSSPREATSGDHPPVQTTTGPRHIRRRLRVPVGDFLPTAADSTSYRAAIARLVRSGLLVAKATPAGQPCVELIHDAVLDRSAELAARLRDLVARDGEFLRWRQQLAGPLSEGFENGKEPEALSGAALRAAKIWLERRPGDLNRAEQALIVRSRRVARIQRSVLAAVMVLIVSFVVYQRWHDQVDEATAAVVAADEHAGRQQWQAAIDGYTGALRRYRQRDSLLLKRARAYEGLANYPAAIDDYTAALATNPAMLEALIGRASARLKAGDYPGAIEDFDRVIQRNPSMAEAYIGRAAARDRRHANADSTLADLTRAYQADSTRLDALFQRGTVNQRLGRRDSAIHDFRRVAGLATNPNDRAAALARLTELSPTTPGPSDTAATAPRGRTTVLLYYVDPEDVKAVAQIRADMGKAGAFQLPTPVLATGPPTLGEVRFLEGDDRSVKDVIDAAERALARSGYRLQLQPRALRSSSYLGSGPRRIEVWLPSLSRSLYSVQQK